MKQIRHAIGFQFLVYQFDFFVPDRSWRKPEASCVGHPDHVHHQQSSQNTSRRRKARKAHNLQTTAHYSCASETSQFSAYVWHSSSTTCAVYYGCIRFIMLSGALTGWFSFLPTKTLPRKRGPFGRSQPFVPIFLARKILHPFMFTRRRDRKAAVTVRLLSSCDVVLRSAVFILSSCPSMHLSRSKWFHFPWLVAYPMMATLFFWFMFFLSFFHSRAQQYVQSPSALACFWFTRITYARPCSFRFHIFSVRTHASFDIQAYVACTWCRVPRIFPVRAIALCSSSRCFHNIIYPSFRTSRGGGGE